MKIAIYAQYYKEDYRKSLLEIVAQLQQSDDSIFFVEKLYTPLKSVIPNIGKYGIFRSFKDLDNSFDAMLTIGGDGTILRAVTYVRNLNIPILGINAGRLGFLATIQQNQIPKMISLLRKGDYKIIERSVIQIENLKDESEDTKKESLNFALNEFTISRKNTTSMIIVDTFLNDEFLTSYWADGLIISTPTGSTGYSLSCGGPVIMPSVESFVITPIAPHNLNARPLVIPDNVKIKLQVTSRENSFFISLDSRMKSLPCSTEIIISKADFNIQMIELHSESFLKTIRKKLLWGEDKRN